MTAPTLIHARTIDEEPHDPDSTHGKTACGLDDGVYGAEGPTARCRTCMTLVALGDALFTLCMSVNSLRARILPGSIEFMDAEECTAFIDLLKENCTVLRFPKGGKEPS